MVSTDWTNRTAIEKTSFILKEDSDFLLLEDGFKFLLIFSEYTNRTPVSTSYTDRTSIDTSWTNR